MTKQKLACDGLEQRRHHRRPLDAEVRFATETDPDARGRIVNISESGLYMKCRTRVRVGEAVIAYPDGFGRLPGTVVWADDDGCAVQFLISEQKRSYLAKRLEDGEGHVLFQKILERRSSARTKLNLEATAVISANESFPCIIVDLSETGAAIEATNFPPIGTRVSIGSIHGVVTRHYSDGFALAFSKKA